MWGGGGGGGYSQGQAPGRQPTWTKPRLVYGADDAEDYDVCTTFVKWGKCSKEGCTWGHDGGVWWDGAWWRDDGNQWGSNVATPAKEQQPSKPSKQIGWWRSLPADEECPVSLTPIRDLEDAPFELTAVHPDCAPKGAPKHRFDATALSMFLVSAGLFMNPINRRPLTLEECRSLDKQMGKSSFRVADAFLLAGGGTVGSAPLREAAIMAHHLFHFRSVRDVEREGRDATDATAANRLWVEAGGKARQRVSQPRDARVVHSDGNLRVLDDNESEADGEGEDPDEFPALATPAASSSSSRPKRALRPPRVVVASTSDSCTAAASANTSCGAGGVTTSSSAVVVAELDKDDGKATCIAAGSSDIWVPPWATVELQQLQLEEVEELLAAEAMTVEAAGLRALRAAVEIGILLTEGYGLRCRAQAECAVARLEAVITVPLFYPSMPLLVTLRSHGAESLDLVAKLERVLREEVMRPAEGGEALKAAIHWLQAEAPDQLKALQAEMSAAAAKKEVTAAAASVVASEGTQADVRKGEKFSPNWDLCSSFAKIGKCKNKNCKWRHEKPESRSSMASGPSAADVESAEPKKKAPAKSKKKYSPLSLM